MCLWVDGDWGGWGGGAAMQQDIPSQLLSNSNFTERVSIFAVVHIYIYKIKIKIKQMQVKLCTNEISQNDFKKCLWQISHIAQPPDCDAERHKK